MASLAAASRLPGATICGPSAAILHGIAVTRVPSHVHLVAADRGWTGRRAGLWLHEWTLPPRHVVTDRTIRITSIPRTWVDVARVDGVSGSVIVGDQLLRESMTGIGELAQCIEELGSAHLLRHARTALPLLDARRESPLESASAAYFAHHKLPLPQWQVEIHDEDGFIGRVDCCWRRSGVIGEADGRLKYVTGDDLYREKRREDRLRAAGWTVMRWGWSDLRGPHLARRLATTLDPT